MPPPPGHTFHNEITRRAHFLIDDVHLYKASDTIFHVDIGNDTLLCDGAHLDITATPEGFKLEDTVTTWMWSTGDTTPTIRVHDPGTYWVEVRINHTYWARDTIVVEYEEFPEWPKPFGDVLEQCNDVGSSWEEISGPELKHGGMYFWSTGSDDYRDNWWDGTHNGEPLPMGVYTYRIVAPLEGRDSFDRVGTVTIVK